MKKLGFNARLGKPVGRLVYHHVAENRGLLLNLIHNAVLEALTLDDVRVPLLYTPSGVVYLERYDAPPMPAIDDLVEQVVRSIRNFAGQAMIEKGFGSQLDKDGLRLQNTLYDFFDLRETIRDSHKFVLQIRTNAPQYVAFLAQSGWPYTDSLPDYSKSKEDVRLRQMAEWASLVETQFEDRLPSAVNQYIDEVFSGWEIHDLRQEFEILRSYKQRGTGIRHRWYWAAAHALNRKQGIQPYEVVAWLEQLSLQLASLLPEDLPESSLVNQAKWEDLEDYVKSALTIYGVKSETAAAKDELTRYTQSKISRSKSVCTICGSHYPTQEQLTNAISFRPNVYTQRIAIGASDNKRRLCSICATEQLLCQLFLENLDTGSAAESQRIRYLSFYPSYFFSPQTLKGVQSAYNAIKTVRLSDSALSRALREQDDLTDPAFWQRLDSFWLRPAGEADDSKFKRVLRYTDNAQATFFTVGFRNIDPTETESWILPTFLALVMAVCLDVKVVVSDSGVPLMLEATELPQTLWFDGAHAAIQAILQHDRPNVDQVGYALARLTAAYLIHLDTEYAPPKENWQRFAPIANALCESPLYVFHYLKQQERDDRPITQDKIRRYIRYADLFTPQGDQAMSHAKELVRLYRGFYRAKTIKNANSILRPISVISDALLIADPRVTTQPEWARNKI